MRISLNPRSAALEELRLAAVEARADAELALGHHASLIAELEGLAVARPARERLAGLLMLALYRSGRQADALEVYQHSRVHLVQQLGLEPGPALTALQVEFLQRAFPSLELTRLGPHNAAEASGLRGPVPMRVGGELPVRSEALFGRERELDELSLLLLDPAAPLVTLEPEREGRGRRRSRSQLRDGRALASRMASPLSGLGISEEWAGPARTGPRFRDRGCRPGAGATDPYAGAALPATAAGPRQFRACDQSRARARAAGGWLPAAEGAGHQPRPLALVVGTRPQGRRSRCA